MYESLNRECLDWQRSTRSGHNGNCVESARIPGSSNRAIRDSKQNDDPGYPMLVCNQGEWFGLLDAIKTGTVDG